MTRRLSVFSFQLLAVGALFWAAGPALLAADKRPGPPKAKPDEPSISLNVYGRTQWIQDASEPLLLSVGLGNPDGAAIEAENRDALIAREAYRRSGVLDKMSDKEIKELQKLHATKVVPTFTVGSKSSHPASVIRWEVTDSAGQPVQVKVRPLASNSSDPMLLDGRTGAILHFGVDAGTLPVGDYQLRAVLDTVKAKGMWKGKVESRKVKLAVRKKLEGLKSKDALLRDYLYGRFYLLDKQYSKVEKYAARLLAADPKSINAWELRGDAMDGSGDRIRAEAAFRQALANFDAKYGGKQAEPPDYLVRRYNEVRSGKP